MNYDLELLANHILSIPTEMLPRLRAFCVLSSWRHADRVTRQNRRLNLDFLSE
jgi:hypothetical protein